MAVVGESFHRPQLDAVTGGGIGETTLQVLLVRQPWNPHDANAIAVETKDGTELGFLSRDNGARFAPGFDRAGDPVLVGAHIQRRQFDHDWNVVLRVSYSVLEGL